MKLLNAEVNSSESVISLAKQVMLKNKFERIGIIEKLKNDYVKRYIKINRNLEQAKLDLKPLDNKHVRMITDAQYIRELYEILEIEVLK